jgi:peptide chain release factor 1
VRKREKEQGSRRHSLGHWPRDAPKNRTYNYPQNRVTDHRIHKSWYALETMMQGYIQDMIDAPRSKSWMDKDAIVEGS